MTTTLRFVVSPPGLDPHRDFALDAIDGAPGLSVLRAVGDEAVRLYVIDPELYLADYTPRVTADELETIGASADEAQVLVVATLDADGPVVNLLAPVIVNPASGVAVQVILDADDWPLRHRLEPAA
ncbi:MAG: flagellar assembly protein FliW [Microbacteriaceae bacterium]